MALPRNQRLTDRADFLRISHQGKTVGDHYFSLRYCSAPASLGESRRANNSRVAIVISSKAIPLATRRNQLRRVISAWLTERWRSNPHPWTDLVIGVKSSCAKLKSDQIKTSLEQLFRKANIV